MKKVHKTGPAFSRLRPIPAAIIASFGTAAAFLIGDVALANPLGGTVVGGQATITTPSSNGTVINQSSNSAIINWQQFNIGSGQYVQFVQPSSSSIALNRVIGGSPSSIFGSLKSNGNVFLINPNGVLFAPGSSVDVGGLLATTMDIKNSDFMAGNYVFSGSGAPGAVISNAGTMTAHNGGFIMLAGDTVSNSGIIQAQLGQVVLASGSATTLDLAGNGLISYSIDKAALSSHAGVSNSGELLADGGRVVMAASTARELVGTAVNNTGLIRAQGISNHDGKIELTATGGDIADSGTLDVSNTTGQGGSIELTGDRDITLVPGAQLLANGTSGGTINAVAADTLDLLTGSLISATGSSGSGGFVEVSGHGLLHIRGDIDLGKGGTLLIDPTNIIINNAQYGGSSSSTETISAAQLQSELQGGTNVQLVASNSIELETSINGTASGTASGTGGGLLLGIGTLSTASYGGPPPQFTRGTGGSITSGGNASNYSIAVDGPLDIESGSGTGTITLGALSSTPTSLGTSSVTLNAGGNIIVNGAISSGNQINVTSTNGTINAGAQFSPIFVAEAVNPGARGSSSTQAASTAAAPTGLSSNYVTLDAGSDVTVSGAINAPQRLNIVSTSGNINIGGININAGSTSYGSVMLNAGSNITSGAINGSTITAKSTTGTVSLGALSAYNVTIGAGSNITVSGAINAVDGVSINSTGGNINTGNITISDNGARGSSSFGINITAQKGNISTGNLVADYTATSADEYGGDEAVNLSSPKGNISTGSIEVSSADIEGSNGGPINYGLNYDDARVDVQSGGNVHIAGPISATGGGSDGARYGTTTASVSIEATGSLQVDGPTILVGHPFTQSQTSYGGYGSFVSSSSTTSKGDATLTLGGSTISMGAISISAAGNAELNATAVQSISVLGAIDVEATRSTSVTSYSDGSSVTQNAGQALVSLITDAPTGTDASSISTAGITAKGPNAQVSLAAGTLKLGAGADGNAIDATANTGGINNTGAAYYQKLDSTGANIVTTDYGSAIVQLAGRNTTAGTPSITSAGIDVSGPAAELTIASASDVSINGNLGVTGLGYTITGDATQVPGFGQPTTTSLQPPILLNGTTTWGAGELIISGYSAPTVVNDSVASINPTKTKTPSAGNVGVTGTINVSGVGQSVLNVDAASLTTGAVTVNASQGTLQGITVSTVTTAGSSDSGSYAGYNVTRTIGDGAGGAATFGQSSASITTSGDVQMASLSLTGLSGQANINAANVTAAGGISVVGSGVPTYVETDTFSGAFGNNPPTLPASATTQWTGDVNQLYISTSSGGAIKTGDLTLTGAGFDELNLSSNSMTLGNVTLTETTTGLFTSNDPTRTASSYSYSNPGAVLDIGGPGGGLAFNAQSVTVNASGPLAMTMPTVIDITGALSITAGSLSSTLPGLANIQHPVLQGAPTTVSTTQYSDTSIDNSLTAQAGSASLILGSDSSLVDAQLTTTGALDIGSSNGSITLTFGSDTTLTGGSIQVSNVSLVGQQNLALKSTTGNITAGNITVDGTLDVESGNFLGDAGNGNGYGTISLGTLSSPSVTLHAGSDITVGGAINATQQVDVESSNGNITTGNITVSDSASRIGYTSYGIAVDAYKGNISTGNLVADYTGNDSDGYGGQVAVSLYSAIGSINTGSIEASSTMDEVMVNASGEGNVHIAGPITVTGGGGNQLGEGSTAVSVGLFSGSGSLQVDGATILVGHPLTQSQTSYGGYGSYGGGSSIKTVEGDATLSIGGSNITMGAISISAVGNAELSTNLSSNYENQTYNMLGAIDVEATRSTSVTSYTDGSSVTQNAGQALVYLGTAAPATGTDTSSISTAGITAKGPDAQVSLAAGTLKLGAGADGNAIDATANTGGINNTGAAYYQKLDSTGANIVTTDYGSAIVQLAGRNTTAGTPSITSAGIDVSGPAAELTIASASDASINGNLGVTGLGYTITGDATQVSGFETPVPGFETQSTATLPPILLNGTTTWGAGQLSIAGIPASSTTTAAAGNVSVTGTINVSGVGQSVLNVDATSLTSGAVTVSASQGTLQGIAVSTVVTAGSSDSGNYAGYNVTRTIGNGASGAATFGQASASITTSGDVQMASLSLTGLSGQANINAANVTAAGGISVVGSGTPTFVEATTFTPFFSYGGNAPAALPNATTTWTGDVNQLVVNSGGKIAAGNITLTGAGFDDLTLAGSTISVGNVSLTQTTGLFTSNDPTRTANSYSYSNPGALLSIIGTGTSTPTATSVSSTTSGPLAINLDANISGALTIDTPSFATSSLPGIASGVHPIVQGNPAAFSGTSISDSSFNERLTANAGSALFTLGGDSTLQSVQLTTTGALDIGSSNGPITLTFDDNSTLTGGSIKVSNVSLLGQQSLELDSTAGDITTGDITAEQLVVNSQGNATLGNVSTSGGQINYTDDGEYVVGSISVNAATGGITIGKISTNALASYGGGADGSVSLSAPSGAINTGTITTNAVGISENTRAAVTITGGSSVTAGDITTETSGAGIGSDVDISAVTGLSTSSIGTTGSIDLTTTQGNLGVTGTLTAGSNVVLAAYGGTVSVGGATQLGSAGHGLLSVNAASGVTFADISNQSVADATAAANDMSISSTGGDILLGNVSVPATGTVSLAVTAGNGSITTGDVSLERVNLNATAGNITTGNLSLFSLAPSAAGNNQLNAGNKISVGTINTDGGVIATASGGPASSGGITIGSISTDAVASSYGGMADGLVSLSAPSGAINVGSITTDATGAAAVASVTLNAGINLQVGAISTTAHENSADGNNVNNLNDADGSVSLTAGNGDLTLTGPVNITVIADNNSTVGGGLSLTDSNGILSTGALSTTYGGISLTNTTGNITTGDLTTAVAFGAISATATNGAITVGKLTTFGGGVNLAAGTGLTTGSITALASTNQSGDRDGSVTLSTVSGNLSVNGPISATADASNSDSLANAGVSISDNSGPITLGSITASATGNESTSAAVTITSGSSVTVGGITTSASIVTPGSAPSTSSDVTINAGTGLSTNSIATTGSIDLTTTQGNLGVTGALNAGSNVDLNAVNANIGVTGTLTAGSNVDLSAYGGTVGVGGATQLGSAGQGLLTVNAASGVTFADISNQSVADATGGADIVLMDSNGSLSTGNISTTYGGISLFNTVGSITTGDLTTAGAFGAISASATSGAITVGKLSTVGGGVNLIAGTGLMTGSITALASTSQSGTRDGSVALTTGGKLSVNGSISTTADASNSDSQANAGVRINDNSGPITLGSISTNAIGNQSNAAVTITGESGSSLTAGSITTTANDYSNTQAYVTIAVGSSVTVGNVTTSASGSNSNSNVTINAGNGLSASSIGTTGSIDLTATQGNLGVTGALTAGSNVVLAAYGGTVSVGGTTQLGSAGHGLLSVNAASGVTFVDISNQSVADATGTANDMSISSTGGDILLGNVSVPPALGTVSLFVTAGNGSITTGDVSLERVNLNATAGNITTGNLSLFSLTPSLSGSSQLNAGNKISVGTISTDGGVIATAGGGQLQLGATSAAGDINLTDSNGNLSTGALSTTDGGISLTDTTGNIATGDLTATGSGAISTIATNGTITVGKLTTVDGDVNLAAGTGLTTGSITAVVLSHSDGQNVSVSLSTGSGNLSVNGPISSTDTANDGVVINDNSGPIALGNIVAIAGDNDSNSAVVTITGGSSVTAGDIMTETGGAGIGTAVTINAGTGLAISSIDTGGSINLGTTQGNLGVTGALTAGSNIVLASGGAVSVGGITTSGSSSDVDISAVTGLSTSSIGTTGSIDLTTTQGNLGVTGTLTAGSNVVLAAYGGTVSVGGATQLGSAGHGLLSVNAASGVTFADISNQSVADATAAANDMSISSTGGDILLGNVSVPATGTVSLAVTAGNGSITTGDVSLERVNLNATAGNITTGNLSLFSLAPSAAGNNQLNAGNKISVGTINTDGGVIATASGGPASSGGITIGSISTDGAGDIMLTASNGYLALGNLSGNNVGLTTGQDFSYSEQTINASGNVTITGNGSVSFNDASVFGQNISVTSAGNLSATNSTFSSTVTTDDLVVRRADAPLAQTLALTSSNGDISIDGSTLNSGRIDINGGNISLLNSSKVNGTQVAFTGSGLVSAGTVVAGVANASTINAGALSVKGSQIDFSDAILTVGTGIADFGSDATLLSRLGTVAPDLLPASQGPNASFSAPNGVALGSISVAGGYLFVQTNNFALPSPTGSSNVFIDFVPTDPNSVLALGAVQPPSSVTTVVFGGTSQIGNIQFGSGTQHFDIRPLNTNFVLDTAGTIFYPDALQTGGRVIVLGNSVMENSNPPPVEQTAPAFSLESVPLTDDQYRTEYDTPPIEKPNSDGSLIDIITSNGAAVCSVGGGQ